MSKGNESKFWRMVVFVGLFSLTFMQCLYLFRYPSIHSTGKLVCINPETVQGMVYSVTFLVQTNNGDIFHIRKISNAHQYANLREGDEVNFFGLKRSVCEEAWFKICMEEKNVIDLINADLELRPKKILRPIDTTYTIVLNLPRPDYRSFFL